MSQHLKTASSLMVMSGVGFLVVDGGVTIGALIDLLSTDGNNFKALVIAVLFGIVLTMISITLFFRVMALAEQPHSSKRTINTSLAFAFWMMMVTLSFFMDWWMIGGDNAQKHSMYHGLYQLNERLEENNDRISDLDDAEGLIKATLEATLTWEDSEIREGSLSGQGSGEGATASLLANNASILKAALVQLSAVTIDYKPLEERGNDLIEKVNFIHSREDLSFDEKNALFLNELQLLSNELERVQNLLPVGVFETLEDNFKVEVDEYTARGIPQKAAVTLFNFYHSRGRKFEQYAKTIQRTKWKPIPSMREPTQVELMFTPGNSPLPYLFAAVLALSTPLMTLLHVIEQTRRRRSEDDEDTNPPSFQHRGTSQPDQSEPETVAALFPSPNTTKH